MKNFGEDFEDCRGAEERPDFLEYVAEDEERERCAFDNEINVLLRTASDQLKTEFLQRLREERDKAFGPFF